MTAAELAARLQARTNGSKSSWEARCPAHEDSSPSLSISVGRNGSVLLHCHAGCSLDAILGSLNLSLSDLHGDEPRPLTPGIAATYDYTDEEGKLLFQVVRMLPKAFRQRVPDGHGDWIWKIGDTRRVLYRLPAILDAKAQERPVYVVEGEKDVATLETWGLTATTCPGGAGKWRPEFTAQLEGCRVIVIPDTDEPGQKHAADILTAIPDATILKVPTGKDITDYALAGGSLEALMAGAPASRYPRAVCFLGAPEPEPIQWLAEGLLPAREICFFSGEGGSYKSTVALTLAVAVASGHPHLNAFPVQPAPVLLLSEEDSLSVLLNRARALIRGLHLDMATTMQNLHAIALEGFALTDLGWTTHLDTEVARLKPSLVVFDPLADMLNGISERDEGQLAPVIKYWRALTRAPTTVLICHHLAKPKEGMSGANRLRGSTALANAARAIFSFAVNDSGLRMTCDKMSRAVRPPPMAIAFEIQSDPANSALWDVATFTTDAPRPAGAMSHRRTLSVTDRKALMALEGFAPETLTFGKWVDVSAVSKSALADSKRKLTDLGYVERIKAGQRAGKDTFEYRLLPAGRDSLADSGESVTTPRPTPADPKISTPRLRRAFIGPESVESELTENTTVSTPPPTEDGFWDSLVEPD